MSTGAATPGPSRRWIVADGRAAGPPPTRAAIPPARPAIAHDCQPGRAEKPEKQVMPRYAHLDGRREAEFARAHGPRCRARPRGGRGKERGGCWRRRTSARAPQMPERRLERGASHSAKSRRHAGRACGNELSRPGFLDHACDQEGQGVPLPDGRDRAAHHVRAVPQAEQAALPRSPDGCAVGWEPLRAGSRHRRSRAEGGGGATPNRGGGKPQSSARPLRRPRQDRSSTKPRQAGASEPMTRKMLDSQP